MEKQTREAPLAAFGTVSSGRGLSRHLCRAASLLAQEGFKYIIGILESVAVDLIRILIYPELRTFQILCPPVLLLLPTVQAVISAANFNAASSVDFSKLEVAPAMISSSFAPLIHHLQAAALF